MRKKIWIPLLFLPAEEWLSGQNALPLLMSLKSGTRIRTFKPVVYKPSESDRSNGSRSSSSSRAEHHHHQQQLQHQLSQQQQHSSAAAATRDSFNGGGGYVLVGENIKQK